MVSSSVGKRLLQLGGWKTVSAESKGAKIALEVGLASLTE